MLVIFILVPQNLRLLKWFLTLAQSTWQWLVHFAMIKQLRISNLRFMMRPQTISSLRMKTGDARPKATTCTTRRLPRFYRAVHPNLPMDQLISRALSGKIPHACSNLVEVAMPSQLVHFPQLKWKITNAHLSNFWPFTRLKAARRERMAFWDCHRIKMMTIDTCTI